MMDHPGIGSSGALNGLLKELQVAEGADHLLAWAEELSQLQASWMAQRQAFIAQHFARQASEAQVACAQRAWLEPLSGQMLAKHKERQQELARSLAEVKARVFQQCQLLAQDCNHLEQASLKRQRLARCRLRREEERLALREDRLSREARERERRAAVRLEAERIRAEERRAKMELEKRRLEAELERDRALWHCSTATTATQTILKELPPATAAAAEASDSYSDDDFDDESFESLSASEESVSSSLGDGSRSASAAIPKAPSIISSALQDSRSVSDRDEEGARHRSWESSGAAADSLASIASSVDLAESIESIQSIHSA